MLMTLWGHFLNVPNVANVACYKGVLHWEKIIKSTIKASFSPKWGVFSDKKYQITVRYGQWNSRQ